MDYIAELEDRLFELYLDVTVYVARSKIFLYFRILQMWTKLKLIKILSQTLRLNYDHPLVGMLLRKVDKQLRSYEDIVSVLSSTAKNT